MQRCFLAHIGRYFLLSGMLRVTDTEIAFCTNKYPFDPKYRHLRMRAGEIAEIHSEAWILPAVIIAMRSGETHRFLVFSRRKFLESAREIGVSVTA